MTGSGPIRVLLADDHQIFREAMVALLKGIDDIEIAGEATNGNEAIEMVEKLQPDVVLLDINMPPVPSPIDFQRLHWWFLLHTTTFNTFAR